MKIINTLTFINLAIIGIQGTLQAQDTTYFDRHFNLLSTPKGSFVTTITKPNPQQPQGCTKYTLLTDSNQMISIVKYSDCANNIRDGKTSIWYEGTNKLKVEIQYVQGQKQGKEKLYYPSGQLKRLLTFDHDSIISGQFFNPDGSVDTEVFKEDLESAGHQIEPCFPGGLNAMYKFLVQNVHYPEEALENGWSGNVVCAFVVDKHGKITKIEVEQAFYPVLGEALANVLRKMPDWEPGVVDGHPVNVRYYLPFVFKLE